MTLTCRYLPMCRALVVSILLTGWLVATLAAREPTPDEPKAAQDVLKTARQLIERAEQKLGQAQEPGEPNAQQLRAEARALSTDARRELRRFSDEITTKLAALPQVINQQKDRALLQQRDMWRGDYLSAQLHAALAQELTADAIDPSNPEHRQALEQAAVEYGEIAKKYRNLIAGLYATMYQGRAYQKQGKLKDALENYVRLLDNLPNEPAAFRDLKTKVLLLAMDCWTADSQRDYAQAVRRGRSWIDDPKVAENRSQDFESLRRAVSHAEKLLAQQSPPPKPR